EASQLSQRFLCADGQPRQLSSQELHHVVCVSLGVDAGHFPGPSPPLLIEGQETFIDEHVKKLDHEERIAVRLRMHQGCERINLLCVAAKCICNKISDVIGR